MGKPLTWTEDMLAALRKLRAEGESVFACSEEIGVCYPTALAKCHELGLAERRNRGRTSGRELSCQRDAR